MVNEYSDSTEHGYAVPTCWNAILERASTQNASSSWQRHTVADPTERAETANSRHRWWDWKVCECEQGLWHVRFQVGNFSSLINSRINSFSKIQCTERVQISFASFFFFWTYIFFHTFRIVHLRRRFKNWYEIHLSLNFEILLWNIDGIFK